jgi:hypothetical protein
LILWLVSVEVHRNLRLSHLAVAECFCPLSESILRQDEPASVAGY